jgi:CRISPR-associated protein Cmr5
MTTISRQQSLEQQRAALAWDCVRSVTENKKDFVSLARGAPADIQANGLGQTLAFWKAKKEPEHRQLYEAVSQWIRLQMKLGAKDVLEWVTKDATTNDYRRATAEAIAFLTWLKRFAEAELET